MQARHRHKDGHYRTGTGIFTCKSMQKDGEQQQTPKLSHGDHVPWQMF